VESVEFSPGYDWWGIGCANSGTLLPQKPKDFRGFQRGW
jgi:hypothetical protein